MTIKRLGILASVVALGIASFACSEPAKPPASQNANAAAQPSDSVKIAPKVLKDEAGPDGSRIIVRQLETGDTVAVRKWDAGPVKKVAKRTRSGETKAIRVVFRDGKAVRVEDKDAVEHALDWTGAQLADIAKKVGKTVEEATDKSDEVGDDDTDAKPKNEAKPKP